MGQLHNLRSAFGPRVVRESGFTGFVEPVRKVLEILGKQVSVAIKSDLNRRVAEVSLNGFRGGALCDQQSSARASQVVVMPTSAQPRPGSFSLHPLGGTVGYPTGCTIEWAGTVDEGAPFMTVYSPVACDDIPVKIDATLQIGVDVGPHMFPLTDIVEKLGKTVDATIQLFFDQF